MRHELKVATPFFNEIRKGNKRFEVRYNDRGYNKGDVLRLKEITNKGILTNDYFDVSVDYVLNDMGLKEGWVAMSITVINGILGTLND